MLFDKDQFLAVGQQTLTVTAAALGFTIPSTAKNVTDVYFRVNDGAVRFLVDGNTATASTGFTGEVDEHYQVTDELEIANFSVINKGSVAGELDIIYLKRLP